MKKNKMKNWIQTLVAKQMLLLLLLFPSIVLGKDIEITDEMLKNVLQPHLPTAAKIVRTTIKTTDLNGDGRTDVFGNVEYSVDQSINSNCEDPQNKLFVALKNKDSDYVMNAISKGFGVAGCAGKSYMEWVEQIGKNSFSVQLNSHSVCGVFVHKYKFKFINGKWRLAGLDERDSVCPDDDNSEVGLEPSYRKSHNFLTGEYLAKYFKAGKYQRSKKIQRKAKTYYLIDFDLDNQYGSFKK
jgi:hypothetical protein